MNSPIKPEAAVTAPAKPSNFLRNIIEADLAAQKYKTRRWSGSPNVASALLPNNTQSSPDSRHDAAAIRTRFPPEPNGYLHIGHAKAICLNFGLARDFGGRCHMRFDDTNPAKEEQEYVDSILDSINWLGFSYADTTENNLYYASDYFEHFYACANYLISKNLAYVDSLSAEDMRAYRGTLTEAGRDSPFRNRSIEENLRMFTAMRAGDYADGEHILRAKIDMASPNINLRDPALYRIKRAHHHRTGDDWCIYPMYTFAHPIEDALENITHSICTLEFEDQRPFYDWLLGNLRDGGFFADPLPQQYEFSRLNLTYIVLSKRYLNQLVTEKYVDGWDDPRMPTLAGARRRGYAAEGIHQFMERAGVSRADSWIDYGLLEDCMRDFFNETAPRRIAVLDPVKLIITNMAEGHIEECHAPNHPQKPELGKRPVMLSRELWIEREDFQEVPEKGFFRLFPGNKVRLRYGFVIECTGCEKDAAGNIVAIHATYFADSKSGTLGSDGYKVKGNIHWLAADHAYAAEVRLYDRLFLAPLPGRGDGVGGKSGNYLDDLNPNSKTTITAYLEARLENAAPEERFQFERHGYFVADRVDSKAGKPVFNRAVTLKDGWSK